MTESGYCSDTGQNCNVNYFCPQRLNRQVQCKPCTDDMILGQGCNCIRRNEVQNCKQCLNGVCIKCLPGTFLIKNECESCSSNCLLCDQLDTCQKCAEGFIFSEESNQCQLPCNINKDCQDTGNGYCDAGKKVCVKCELNCEICSDNIFCYKCIRQYNLNSINGTCEKYCLQNVNGKYCKDGNNILCSDGLTSACYCEGRKNCASCNADNSGCATCFHNFDQTKDGDCLFCKTGYEQIGAYCYISQQINDNKISSGAIVGIVIGILALCAVVGGSLAYYFIGKAKINLLK
ncbi:Cysteine-rich membrane protein 2 [Spironucleus salmonicida]|uniref:Cysteine-rich membrane protein 2 n=1 Tax=Spironucleus salmonicida TaxID=348837 RepID=A0A9P8LQL4_9EUKA|nr:Cysteine-rich membrane protein 2 [Spironucleus salmonicida]KAH0572557.1 Cysteine-rich membrane protein 2 [Spironucleus salmonicida]